MHGGIQKWMRGACAVLPAIAIKVASGTTTEDWVLHTSCELHHDETSFDFTSQRYATTPNATRYGMSPVEYRE